VKKFLLIAFIFALNCVQYAKYIPDPEKDIEKWIDNFNQQISFSYEYRLRTMSVATEAKGICVVGRGEHVRGIWYASDRELQFEYIGIGDIEYGRKNGMWQRSSRGEESDILTQIKRLLEFDKFEYFVSEKYFSYRFKANIPFLAPGRRKEMIGLIMISKRDFLPKKIWAGLPDSSVFWEIEISDYNKRKRIKSPIQNWNTYSFIGSDDDMKSAKKRLKLIDVDHVLKMNGANITLTMPNYFGLEDITRMLSNRTLNMYAVTEQKEDAKRIAYDASNIPVFLTDKLFDENDIKDAKIRRDRSSRFYLELSLKKKVTPPSTIAFELDGSIVGKETLDTSKKINKLNLYTNMQYFDMQILRASLLQPLPSISLERIIEEID